MSPTTPPTRRAAAPLNYNDARWPQALEQYSEEIHLASREGSQLWGRKFTWLAGIYLLKISDEIDLFTSGQVTGGSLTTITPFPLYSGTGTNCYESPTPLSPTRRLKLLPVRI